MQHHVRLDPNCLARFLFIDRTKSLEPLLDLAAPGSGRFGGVRRNRNHPSDVDSGSISQSGLWHV